MEKVSVDIKNAKILENIGDYRQSLGKLLDLTDEQKDRLKKRIKKELNDWLADNAGLHRILQDIYDLSEGEVVRDEDDPFPGAASFHIDLCGIYLRVVHSVLRRSILGADSIWYGETDPEHEELDEQMAAIDDMINFKARREWNVSEAISEAIYCAGRDGLAALKILFEDETEDQEDVLYIESPEQFKEEFSDAASAGLSDEEYEALAQTAEQATPDTPLEIPVSFDKVTYYGPKAYLIERVDLVTFPAHARSLERGACRGYGDRFYLNRSGIKQQRDDGKWWKKETGDLIRKTRSGSKGNDYRLAREQSLGISRTGKSDEYEFFNLVYWFDLEKGKGMVKIDLVYCLEEDELVAVRKYHYRVNCMALFRINGRPNQLDGHSIVLDLEEPNEEIDFLHNQRGQSRQIANVPTFKGKKARIEDFDPWADENRWGPGRIFWLNDPETFEQFQVQPTDHGNSLLEEQNLHKIAAVKIGIDAFQFAGLPSQDDPEAPGNKTALLIQQGNLRMEDPLAELRTGVEDVGNICLSHLYQFGPSEITYKSEKDGQMKSGSVPRRILRTGISMRMAGISIVLNPDSEFARWVKIHGFLMSEPAVNTNPVLRINSMRRTLRNGRIPGRNELLPAPEEVHQMAVDIQKQAIMQLQQERAAQQQQAVAENSQQAAQDQGAKLDAVKKVMELKDKQDEVRHNAANRKLDLTKKVIDIKKSAQGGPDAKNVK